MTLRLGHHLGHHGHHHRQRIRISPVKIPGRIQSRHPVKAQQLKTKPDYAFGILGCCGTLRDNERTDEARYAMVDIDTPKRTAEQVISDGLRLRVQPDAPTKMAEL